MYVLIYYTIAKWIDELINLGTLQVIAIQIDEHEDMVCFDGTLAWKQDLNRKETPCYGVAKVIYNHLVYGQQLHLDHLAMYQKFICLITG